MQLHVRFRFGLDPYPRIFLRIFQDDFPQKVKNIHDEMEKHHSYKKKSVYKPKASCFVACRPLLFTISYFLVYLV